MGVTKLCVLKNVLSEKGHEMCVSSSADGSVILWDLIWGHHLFRFDSPGNTGLTIVGNSDFYVCTSEGKIQGWNTRGDSLDEIQMDCSFKHLGMANGGLIASSERCLYIFKWEGDDKQLRFEMSSDNVYGDIDSPNFRGDVTTMVTIETPTASLTCCGFQESGMILVTTHR